MKNPKISQQNVSNAKNNGEFPEQTVVALDNAPVKLGAIEKLDGLDGLLLAAEGYASSRMRTIGSVPPALLLNTTDAVDHWVVEVLDKAQKHTDHFINAARLCCLAHGTTSAVLVTQMLVEIEEPGQMPDQTNRPTKTPDQLEVLGLLGQSSTGLKQKFLPIIRYLNGKFYEFGEEIVPWMEPLDRFALFLTANVPDQGMRNAARNILDAEGIPDLPGHDIADEWLSNEKQNRRPNVTKTLGTK